MQIITTHWVRLASLLILMVSATAAPASAVNVAAPNTYLTFNGKDEYVQVPSDAVFSPSGAGLTIAVWMRPDSLTFSKTEGSLPSQQYVHWFGKGQQGQQEWTFRMYSLTQPGPRQNRISFYVFSAAGGRGCGSYFQDPIQAGQWLFVVGVQNPATHQVSIYKNGQLRHSDSYASLPATPQGGSAPLRIGSKDLTSYFLGAIGPITIWDRPLSSHEVSSLFNRGAVPQAGLVAQYLMNEGTGTTLHDSVGKHNGTISGATWGSGGGIVGAGGGQSGGGC